MKKGIILTTLTGLLVIYISSCYNNKSDIPALPKVSFLRDVVTVVTSGACGCHNNVNANSASNNAIAFSLPDAVRQGGGYRFWRHPGRNHMFGRPVRHGARKHRTPGDDHVWH